MEESVLLTPDLEHALKSLGHAIPTPRTRIMAGGAEAMFLELPWTSLYETLKTGRFENVPLLAWMGPDQFRFLQPADSRYRFRYVRHDGRVLEPAAMDTDGGSIPWAITGIDGFSPWGYAPAFLIHDWLYIAHKCGNAPDNQWTFEETALLMAECMKTLILLDRPSIPGKLPKNYLPRIDGGSRTVYTMYRAVTSSFARKIFNDPTTATCYADPDLGYLLEFRPKA